MRLGQAGDPFGALFGGLFGPPFGIETRPYRFDPASGRWVEMTDELPDEQTSADDQHTESGPGRGRKPRSVATLKESPQAAIQFKSA